MARFYFRHRRINPRFCFYLSIALVTIVLVAYQWAKGGNQRPLALFSTHEYSSDLPKEVQRQEKDADGSQDASGNELTKQGSEGDTMRDRMFRLFGLTDSKYWPSTVRGKGDNIDSMDEDVEKTNAELNREELKKEEKSANVQIEDRPDDTDVKQEMEIKDQNDENKDKKPTEEKEEKKDDVKQEEKNEEGKKSKDKRENEQKSDNEKKEDKNDEKMEKDNKSEKEKEKDEKRTENKDEVKSQNEDKKSEMEDERKENKDKKVEEDKNKEDKNKEDKDKEAKDKEDKNKEDKNKEEKREEIKENKEEKREEIKENKKEENIEEKSKEEKKEDAKQDATVDSKGKEAKVEGDTEKQEGSDSTPQNNEQKDESKVLSGTTIVDPSLGLPIQQIPTSISTQEDSSLTNKYSSINQEVDQRQEETSREGAVFAVQPVETELAPRQQEYFPFRIQGGPPTVIDRLRMKGGPQNAPNLMDNNRFGFQQRLAQSQEPSLRTSPGEQSQQVNSLMNDRRYTAMNVPFRMLGGPQGQQGVYGDVSGGRVPLKIQEGPTLQSQQEQLSRQYRSSDARYATQIIKHPFSIQGGHGQNLPQISSDAGYTNPLSNSPFRIQGDPSQNIPQIPPDTVIQKSLGLGAEDNTEKLQQMYAAYLNATSDEDEEMDETKRLVEEGKERLKDHVSALQLLKIKQELVRYGLSPEISDRLLSSPNPQAIIQNFPPSAQTIIRQEWPEIKVKLDILKTGSTLEHVKSNRDLLRPTEVSVPLLPENPPAESGKLEATELEPQQNIETGVKMTTLPSSQGYDNPRPLSDDAFLKLITPPTPRGAPPITETSQDDENVSTFDLSNEPRETLNQMEISDRASSLLQQQMQKQRQQQQKHSLLFGRHGVADEEQPEQPLNLIPHGSDSNRPGQEVSACPRSVSPAINPHQLTALVSFPGADTFWVRELLEQLSGEETDSMTRISTASKDGDMTSVRLMRKKVAIETHKAAISEFERAIVVISNPFSAEKDQTIDWKKNFLWGGLYTFWLSTDIPALVLMYDDLVAKPQEHFQKIIEFLSLPEGTVNYQCAMEVVQKAPEYISDMGKLADIYSKDRRRINSNIDTVINAALKRYPSIVDRLETYKLYKSHIEQK